MRSNTIFNILVEDGQLVLTIAVQCFEGQIPRQKSILVRSTFGNQIGTVLMPFSSFVALMILTEWGARIAIKCH